MAIDNGNTKGGIDFAKTFGAKNDTAVGSNQGSASTQPKAQFWLNIGYNAEGAGDDGEDRFVALPVGIPLDTQKHVETKSQNDGYRQFMSARNDLLDQMLAAAEKLAPGEGKLLNIQVQLRRVAADQAPVEPSENKFTRSLEL